MNLNIVDRAERVREQVNRNAEVLGGETNGDEVLGGETNARVRQMT